MAARKLQQEVEKCFKKVHEGIAEFEGIYEKIEQCTNVSQKEKLEDNLKREIKKLQRLRDQIKTWHTNNDIKDKEPLLEHRKLIETQMEKFKAVEKAMKTKAYSKEGLSAATKLDPQEQAKVEACDFLSASVEELERQIEQMEAEGESMRATVKKGKLTGGKAERMSDIEEFIERHKWHQGKLELMRRSLENGGLDVKDVQDLKETITYYLTDGMASDYMEDEQMYDDLNLADEEDIFGMNNDNDRDASVDNQSAHGEASEPERSNSVPGGKAKATSTSEPPAAAARRPSTQLKSPLPALATLHTTPLNNVSSSAATAMKPATVPTRPPGEVLKYASAAAAAAASERNNVGIAPLPPPPTTSFPPVQALPPMPTSNVPKGSATSSPAPAPSHPVQSSQTTSVPPVPVLPDQTASSNVPPPGKSPAPSQGNAAASGTQPDSVPQTPVVDKPKPVSNRSHLSKEHEDLLALITGSASRNQTNGASNGATNHEPSNGPVNQLPPALKELTESFEANQKRVLGSAPPSQAMQRMMAASQTTCPDSQDAERPVSKSTANRCNTPAYYPQDPLPIFNDPRLYSRIDTDTLFYIFYYRQNTFQQYLAAKALKEQSWRFHRQYQTWFQRHEEPKNITDEYEQGTYRFFDYESTWMNRRKADFKFAYRFLEDVV
eukprot:GHVU01172172.1.p1 GENE.GHVU01172172.1~~GHVU01172172.1.p1  ORF type:complete len:673 (-),score=96.37 GHVU01172172.1:208-2202(-)